MLRGFSHSVKAVPDTFYFGYCGWVRDDRPLIRTRDDLLELIAHVLRLQLSYLSKDQALAVADTILRTFKAARLSIGSADDAGSPRKRMENVFSSGAPVFPPAQPTTGPMCIRGSPQC